MWSHLPYLSDISYFCLLSINTSWWDISYTQGQKGTLSYQCVKELGSGGSCHLAGEYSPASFSAFLINDKFFVLFFSASMVFFPQLNRVIPV